MVMVVVQMTEDANYRLLSLDSISNATVESLHQVLQDQIHLLFGLPWPRSGACESIAEATATPQMQFVGADELRGDELVPLEILQHSSCCHPSAASGFGGHIRY